MCNIYTERRGAREIKKMKKRYKIKRTDKATRAFERATMGENSGNRKAYRLADVWDSLYIKNYREGLTVRQYAFYKKADTYLKRSEDEFKMCGGYV